MNQHIAVIQKKLAVPAGISGTWDFEETGAPLTWVTQSGTPDFDNAVSPPSGAQSLRLTAGDSAACYFPFTPQDEMWFEFIFRIASFDGDNAFLYVSDGTAQYVQLMRKSGSGGLTINDHVGGALAETGDALASDTWLHGRLHIVKGTGANAFYEVEWGTYPATFIGSGTTYASFSSGSLTNQVSRFGCERSPAAGNQGYDDIKYSNTGWPV